MRERDHRLDNMRCALIMLVVFCHLLVETSEGPLKSTLYQVIYVFHMPAFVFVTGYFARWRPERIARGLLLPYAEFQVLSTVWRNYSAGRAWFAGFTLLQPLWTLWYLLACALWCATTPLLERVRNNRARLGVIAITFVASIAVGFVPWVGSTLDLSRLIVLYPFFCAGFYAGKLRVSDNISTLNTSRIRGLRIAATFAVIILMAVHYAHGVCPKNVLYRDAPYDSVWDCETRVILQLAACAWTAWLLLAVPKQSVPGITRVGRNTLSIYLLHTWLIRVLRVALPLPGDELAHVIQSAILAIAFCELLGGDALCARFRYVFCCGWLDRRHASS